MISPVLQAWRQSSPHQRAILRVRAAYTIADLIVFRYGGFAFVHGGGDFNGLVWTALILSVAIGIGYSGGGLFFRRLGLRSTRSVLALGFAATLVAPLGFVWLDPKSAAILFAIVHGFGHGAFYLGYFAYMLRHSHDDGRDKVMAFTTAQSQFLALLVPLIVVGVFVALDAAGWPTSPFLIGSLCLAAGVGGWQAMVLDRNELPAASGRRALAMVSDPRSLPMICWAAALRMNLAEDAVLFAAVGTFIVGTASGFGWVQMLVVYIGFATSCRWTAVAARNGRVQAMGLSAALMALTAWLTPLGIVWGATAFVLVSAARNAVKPVWGSVTSTLEMHLGGDGTDMTIMVVRDTAVGVGRVVFLALLALAAAIIQDPLTTVIAGFFMLGTTHALAGILTPLVFPRDQPGQTTLSALGGAESAEASVRPAPHQ